MICLQWKVKYCAQTQIHLHKQLLYIIDTNNIQSEYAYVFPFSIYSKGDLLSLNQNVMKFQNFIRNVKHRKHVTQKRVWSKNIPHTSCPILKTQLQFEAYNFFFDIVINLKKVFRSSEKRHILWKDDFLKLKHWNDDLLAKSVFDIQYFEKKTTAW